MYYLVLVLGADGEKANLSKSPMKIKTYEHYHSNKKGELHYQIREIS